MAMRGAAVPVAGPVRALLAGLGAGALTFGCGLPYWAHHPFAAAVSVLASAAFGAAGGLLLDTGDGRQRSGLLLLAGSAFGAFAWLAGLDSGGWPLLSFYSEGVCLIVSGAAVLIYPTGVLTDRVDRYWVYAAAAVLLVGELFLELVSRPEWNGLSPDVLWPALRPDRGLFGWMISAVVGLQLVLAGWYLLLLVRRGRALPRTERPAAVPVLVATGLTVAALALGARDDTLTDLDALLALYAVQNTISVALPLAVLSGALRDRWREVAAPSTVVRLTAATTSVATVRDALASALHDPPLRLLFWVPAEQAYVDHGGRLAHRPEDLPPAAGRWWTEARTDERLPLALVELDDGLRLRPTMVDAVLRAGSQALLTAQLQAVATAQLEQVLAAQARIQQRETAERERLEGDLRAGAQRQLAALAARLDRLAHDGRPEAARAVAASCHEEALATIADLESLARGLHPAVLRSHGLRAALDEVAARLRLAVSVIAEIERQPASVEGTAYFTLCEGLTNVAKYAPGARVQISVTASGGWLHGSVADDGPGGARIVPGGGLAGVEDRIRALGGRSDLESSPDAGTRLRFSLPGVVTP